MVHRSADDWYVPMRYPRTQRGTQSRPSSFSMPEGRLADVDYIRAVDDSVDDRVGNRPFA